MPQKLTDRQATAVDQSIPAVGQHGAGNRLSDVLNSLFLLGGKLVTYTTNATINTQDTVAHGLGYTPQGYIVVNNGNGGVVYTGVAADATNLYLKCTTASDAVTLLVF